MRLLTVDPARPEPDRIAAAAAVLRAGGLVAFPTETVYGLGANALDPDAVRGIYAAKGRPSYNPLIVHVTDADAAAALAAEWPESAVRLAAAFWPGPLTIVVPKRAVVPDLVTAGLPALGLRVPSHPVAHALLAAAGLPVAAPSANRFTELSPTRAAHVAKSLGERVDIILDGGPTHVGIESAVVDLTGDEPRLLRPGVLSPERVAEVLARPLAPAPAAVAGAPRASPGMVERHYAPRARLRVVDARALHELAGSLSGEAAARTGALLLAPWRGAPLRLTIAMPGEPAAFASRLYAALHEVDDAGCADVLVERPPPGPAWDGVHDRLTRAATTH